MLLLPTTHIRLSFPEVIRARKPREVFEQKLIVLLTKRLKELKITWGPIAFRGGLQNPKLPIRLLEKLESLLTLAEAIDWKVSKTLKDELDNAIEDIESFNPQFQKALKRASQDFRAGHFITQEEFEKRLKTAGRKTA